jgi:acyl-homoserine lactone acylase PvdQ
LADASGNISYQYIGRLPRRAGSDERLFLPRDATNPADDWQGFIYMAQLPTVTNASRGYIVSANNPPMKNRAMPYGLNWEPSSRADRIAELIESGGKLDASGIERIQTDIVSPYDLRRVLPYLLALYPDPHPPMTGADNSSSFLMDSMRLYWKEDSLSHRMSNGDSGLALVRKNDSIWLALHRPPEDTIKPQKLDPFTAQVLDYLRNWDGGMRPEEISPAIYSVFLNRLIYRTYHDALGTERYAEFIYLDNLALESLARIMPDTGNIWWNSNRGPGSDVQGPGAGRDSIIQTSFREALQILALAFGPDIRQWQWGKLHTLTFRHPFDRASKLIAKLVNVEAGPFPGGPTTVLQGAYYLWDPYKMQVGPSMRMIADMKSDELLAVLPTGNSEAVFGDNYSDMLPLYKLGSLVRIPLDGQAKPDWKRVELKPKSNE